MSFSTERACKIFSKRARFSSVLNSWGWGWMKSASFFSGRSLRKPPTRLSRKGPAVLALGSQRRRPSLVRRERALFSPLHRAMPFYFVFCNLVSDGHFRGRIIKECFKSTKTRIFVVRLGNSIFYTDDVKFEGGNIDGKFGQSLRGAHC